MLNINKNNTSNSNANNDSTGPASKNTSAVNNQSLKMQTLQYLEKIKNRQVKALSLNARRLEMLAIELAMGLLTVGGVAAALLGNMTFAAVSCVLLILMIPLELSHAISDFMIPAVVKSNELKVISHSFQGIFNKCTNSKLIIKSSVITSKSHKLSGKETHVHLEMKNMPEDPVKALDKLHQAYSK